MITPFLTCSIGEQTMQFNNLHFATFNDLLKFLRFHFESDDGVQARHEFTQFDAEVESLPTLTEPFQSTVRVFLGGRGDVFIGREGMIGERHGVTYLHDMLAGRPGYEELDKTTRSLILEAMTKRWVPAEMLMYLSNWRRTSAAGYINASFSTQHTQVIEKTRAMLDLLIV